MFYDVYGKLCREKGLKPSPAAMQIGINKGSVSYWKTHDIIPSSDVLQKISNFFGVSVDFLMGKSEQKETPTLIKKDEREITFDDFTYALHNESKELTDENKQKLLEMAKLFKLSQEQDKK